MYSSFFGVTGKVLYQYVSTYLTYLHMWEGVKARHRKKKRRTRVGQSFRANTALSYNNIYRNLDSSVQHLPVLPQKNKHNANFFPDQTTITLIFDCEIENL